MRELDALTTGVPNYAFAPGAPVSGLQNHAGFLETYRG